MRLQAALAGLVPLFLLPSHARAQDAGPAGPEASSADGQETDAQPYVRPAAGMEVWASHDSDGTDVTKVMWKGYWHFYGPDDKAGIAVERAHYSPAAGGPSRTDTRVYLDAAGKVNANWEWSARVGTDGHTVLGNAEVRKTDWSTSFFVERDIVETRQGLDNRLAYTFVGASQDIKIDDHNVFSLTAGVQDFTGDNTRYHLRANFVHVLKEDIGLSGQIRARYYHSTHPGEYDYYSPRNFFQVIPVLQMRRFDSKGWMYLGAVGYGAQKATGSGWTGARYANLRIESPRSSRNIDVFAEALYANDSITRGPSYDYLMGRVGVTFGF